MTKRSDRPWELPRWQEQLHLAQAVLQAPSVTVDGVRYWSDRFYLNQLESESVPVIVGDCVCGAQKAPPLLSRERLVQSLDLKAAVLATFSTNLQWLQRTFPNLVGPNATVPTLLLHGDKSCQAQLDASLDAADNDDDDDTCQSSQQHSVCPEVDTSCNNDALNSTYTPSKTTKSPTEANFLRTESSATHPVHAVTCEKGDISTSPSLGRLCYSAYVAPAFNMTPDVNPHVSNESTPANNQPCRKPKRGVHHPKFMLLLESTGDLVVVISTANLTPSRTTEGTWVQRFSANRRFQHQRSRGDSTKRPVAIGNDFGVVLQDFIEKLDGVTPAVDIADFFDRYMNVSLAQLAPSFHFEKAQVHLVSVVPGHFKPNCHLYGRQRVHAILQREALVQSTDDKLVLQPTSLGANWKQAEMADVVRSYLDSKSTDEEALLDRVDLVWPSHTYIRNIYGEPKPRYKDDQMSPSEETNESSFVFLSTQAFNSCDRSCITRLTRFESADPPQRPSTLVPHFKSIARVVKDHSIVRTVGFQEPAQDFLSWFLLTSACMSHGAQGRRVKDEDPFSIHKETIQYANFELGVLFTSKLHPREKRLYCFHPRRCSCRSLSDPQQKMIHLPIPYSLHPKPYLLHDDDLVMQDTPFFHEIDNGSRCVGNMLLTPFGIKEAKKASNKLRVNQ